MTSTRCLAACAAALTLWSGAALARDPVPPAPVFESHQPPPVVRPYPAVGPATPAAVPAPVATPVVQRDAPIAAANPAHENPSPTIDALVVKHAHDTGVPVELANAVIRIESRFNPRARNRGALGLMQIKAGTARNLGFSGDAAALMSPDTNLRYGMKVLAEAYRVTGGDTCHALAYYQSGHKVSRLSSAQRSYCARARTFMAHL